MFLCQENLILLIPVVWAIYSPIQSTSQIRMQGKVKFFKMLTYRQTLAWCKGPNHVGKVGTSCSYFIQLPHLFKHLQLFSPYESSPDVKYPMPLQLVVTTTNTKDWSRGA